MKMVAALVLLPCLAENFEPRISPEVDALRQELKPLLTRMEQDLRELKEHVAPQQSYYPLYQKIRELEKKIEILESRYRAIEGTVEEPVYGTKGTLQWQKGLFPGGEDAYKAKLPPKKSQLQSASDPSSYKKALDFLAKGEVEEARLLLQGVPMTTRVYPYALYWLGRIAMTQDRDPVQASAWFSRAYQRCEKEPQHDFLAVKILIKLSSVLRAQNKKEAAKVVLGQCQQKAQSLTLPKNVNQEMEAERKALGP